MPEAMFSPSALEGLLLPGRMGEEPVVRVKGPSSTLCVTMLQCMRQRELGALQGQRGPLPAQARRGPWTRPRQGSHIRKPLKALPQKQGNAEAWEAPRMGKSLPTHPGHRLVLDDWRDLILCSGYWRATQSQDKAVESLC